MNRRDMIIRLGAVVGLGALGSPAFALSYADDIVAQLTTMGFEDIEVETTWLGRVRIIAKRSDGVREIVLNPRTGEILRDAWTPVSGDGKIRTVLDDVDDDGDDDRNDDDHSGSDDDNDSSGSGSGDDGGGDDDNSGPGGGDDDNSGSGGGGDDEPDREDD